MILQQILSNPQQYSNVLIIDDIYSRRFVPLIFTQLLSRHGDRCFIIDADQSADRTAPSGMSMDRVLLSVDGDPQDSITALYDRIVGLVFKNDEHRDDGKNAESDQESRVVVLNSLSSLVYRYGAAKSMALVQRLIGHTHRDGSCEQGICVVAIVHGDSHDHLLLEQMKLNTHAVIRLRDVFRLRQLVGDEHEEDLESIDKELKRQERERLALMNSGRKAVDDGDLVDDSSAMHTFQAHLLCNIFSMRLRSKLLFHKEYFKVDGRMGALIHVRNPFQNKMLQESMQRAADKGARPTKSTDTANMARLDQPRNARDIDAQLPFRLSLSEHEKRQRESVVLPYVREGIQLAQQQQQQQQQQALSSRIKGLIIVDSDEEFDDEDPDEDLEI